MSPRPCARARRRPSTPGPPQSTPSAVPSSLSLRGSRCAAFGEVDSARGAPQTLEIVIMARSFGEDVHDEAAEIEQHPFGAGFAFTVDQIHADPRELLFDLVADGNHLRAAEAGADQKAVGKRAKPLKVKQRYFGRLLFLRRGDGRAKGGLQRILFFCNR